MRARDGYTVTAIPGTAVTGLALLSAALLGLRHGIDYDHLAAISDISAVEAKPGRAMRLGLLYAVGHGVMVALLGLSVIVFRISLPGSVDGWMGQVVGATLLVLGGYVLYADSFRHQHKEARLRSRVLLVVDGVLWLVWRVRQLSSRKPLPQPSLSPKSVGPGSAVGLGLIHGIGAETPTQLLIFLIAANLGGIKEGILGLTAFLTGLFSSNALLCAAAAGVIRATGPQPRRLRWVARASAAYSMAVGGMLLVAPIVH